MGIYFDNSATSFPKPKSVYTSVMQFMEENGASPGRGNYAKAMEAEQLVYDTRKALSTLLGIKRPGQIVFTSNATESINLVLKGYLQSGDKVLTTTYEHNAMWRPLKTLEQQRGTKIEQITSAPNGAFDLQQMKEKIKDNIKLVAVTHGSNVIGAITPIEEIIRIAHEYDVPVLVDTAQTAGVYPINVTQLEVDFLAFTGHKGLMGPTGTGGLYIREGMQLNTFKEGGTGSMAVSPFQPDDPPDRFEAGTMNIFGLAGLNASARFLLDVGVEAVRKHEVELMHHLMDGLQAIPNLKYYGPDDANHRLGLVSFNFEGQNPYKVAQKLDEDYGIMVRAGLHCAPQAHQLLGTQDTGAVRVSIGYFNTLDEVKTLVDALNQFVQ